MRSRPVCTATCRPAIKSAFGIQWSVRSRRAASPAVTVTVCSGQQIGWGTSGTKSGGRYDSVITAGGFTALARK